MKVHRDKFNEIKRFYIIGGPDKSHLLTGYEIKTLNPDFMEILRMGRYHLILLKEAVED